MKLLLEITDKDVNDGSVERFDKPYRFRKAARAVVFNNKNEIAFQFVSKHNYHKLPGGGVEKGETTFEALEREVLEETGYKIKVGKEIGAILEYRNEFNMLQISYCYFAKAEEKISEPNYEKEEIEGGFQPLWLPIDEAIKLLENDNPTTYDGRFIVKRDLCFLKEMKL